MPAKKGSKSKTHKGDLDYTTKHGDEYFHEGGHRIEKTYKPYNAHKGSVSKTHSGLDYQHYHKHNLKIPLAGGGALRITICHDDSDSDEYYSDMEGEGLWDTIRGGFRTASDKAKLAIDKANDLAHNTVNRIKDVAHKVYTGDTGMPPNVQQILNQYGNQLISKIDIVRNPVGNALVGALSVASRGEFGKNLKNAPYDKLFHLKIVITLQDGTRISMEKVERVNLVVNPQPVKDEEATPTPLNGQQLTLEQLYDNAKNAMGDRFYPYSARDNNCQNFILNVLQASGVGNQQDYEFVKQDTKSLFGDDTFLRKASNTITDIGARFNVLQQGGAIDDDYLHTAINLMHKQKKDKKGLVATNTIPITGGYVGGKLTFKDFAHGWAKHHKITHGGALKSKKAKDAYKTINDHLLMHGAGWDDFVNGAKTFFTGGYNDQINQGIQGAVNKVVSGIDAFGNEIKGTADQIKQKILSQSEDIISKIKSGVTNGIGDFKQLISNAQLSWDDKMRLVKEYANAIKNKVVGGVMTGVDAIKKYGAEAINWIKDNKDAMKAIAISIAKFAVQKGIPLAGEHLGGIFADFLAAGMLQPELIPVAQTLGSVAGKKLGDMLADYIMSLGLADAQGNPDADKWLAVTGHAIDAAKMAYSGYQGLKSASNYLSGAADAGKAVGSVATAGAGVKRRTTAKTKKLLKESLDNYHLVNKLKRGRGRPPKTY